MWRPLFPEHGRGPDHARHERRSPADVRLRADARAARLATSTAAGSREPDATRVLGERLARSRTRSCGRPAARHAPGWSTSSVPRRSRTASCAGSSSTTCAAVESSLEPDSLTIGFARRLATYKRFHLLAHDPERARRHLHGRACRAARDRRQGAPEPTSPGKDGAPALLRLRARRRRDRRTRRHRRGLRHRRSRASSSPGATSGSTCRASRWRRAGRAA